MFIETIDGRGFCAALGCACDVQIRARPVSACNISAYSSLLDK